MTAMWSFGQEEIDPELRCAHCNYNLRGRDADEGCPECAYPVGATLAQRVGSRGDYHYAASVLAAAKAADVPLGSAIAVMHAIDNAHLARVAAPASVGSHCGSEEVCRSLIELAEGETKSISHARRMMRTLELTTCADVGRVVAAFIQVGLIETNPDESPKQYNTLETIERWLSE